MRQFIEIAPDASSKIPGISCRNGNFVALTRAATVFVEENNPTDSIVCGQIP
jgi:hypothetical protein